MKKIILLLVVLFCIMQKKGFTQQLNDNKAWTQVDGLEKKGLYRSAWNQVNRIYSKAVRNHDDEGQLKALIYQLKYRSKIAEDASEINIGEVDSLLSMSSGIKKAILQSMLAEMYRHYVQANRYNLYNRITSTGENEKDISTWSLEHFYKKITGLYKSSLLEENALQGVRLKAWSVLVDTGRNTLALQPTLYDLLGHRALDYFIDPERDVIRPAAHFVIDRAAAFDPALTFSAVKLPGKDTADLSYEALLLYKKLIRFHLQDDNSAALIDLDLQRLQYVYRKAVMPEKDQLYLAALEHIINQYGKASAAQAVYLLAQWHYDQGLAYDAITHPEGKDELNKALALCETLVSMPDSGAAISSRRLKDDIVRPAVSLETELVNVPAKPFRVLVSYKNAAHLSFRLVKLPEEASLVFSDKTPKLQYLLGQSTVKSWQQRFPDPGDHQQHRAEMKIDPLPHGRYALLVSNNGSFEDKNSPVESVVFYVSHISYLQNGQGEFLVLNRQTGEPLQHAQVKMWQVKYNQDKRKSEIVISDTGQTDEKGCLRIKTDDNHANLMAEIDWEGDHLFTGQPQWIPYAVSGVNEKDTTIEKTYLFTDRSIYRPGQRVYFKGITFNYALPGRQSKAVAGKKETVYLMDANHQKTDSLNLVSNNYGSYAGSFVLPEASLRGVMTLRTANDQAVTAISVEDYKRPTFSLQWDTTGEKYRLGDTVNIGANVLSYTQAVVDGAAVSYQVTRRTRVVFPWYRGRGMVYPPRSAVASIAQGVTTTDGKGNFRVSFPAIPDETTDSALNPVFIYVISAEVTDMNGESHSFSYELPLGYKSLELQWHVEDKISVKELDSLSLSSTTLAGTFVPEPVTIRLYPLTAPQRYIRPRYWQQPDEFIMDKADYLQYFPHDEYSNEADPGTWERRDAVYTGELQTNSRLAISLHAGKLPAGFYALEAEAKDEDGHEVKAVKYLELYRETDENAVFHAPLWISKKELEAQPGEQVNWLLATKDKTYLFAQDEREDHIGDVNLQRLDDEFEHVSLHIGEADNGGIIRHYLTVKYNRVFSEAVTIKVPWKNKQLHIEYKTFRDKLLPGAEEKWEVKISGKRGEQVSAELLASMYDASLDALRPHDWSQPDIYPLISGKINWQPDYGFNQIGSYPLFSPKAPRYPVYSKVYPSVKWFGYVPERRFPPSPVFMYARGAKTEAVSDMARQDNQAMAKEAVVEAAAGDSVALQSGEQPVSPTPVRKNFNETAFFFPQLHTDDSGNVVLSFTMPEALTRWKLMLFAHTQDMKFAFSQNETVTRKPLMIQAGVPRFVRQGDQLVFSAKVTNTSSEDLKGNAHLALTNLVSGEPVDASKKQAGSSQSFTVNSGQSTTVKWTINIREDYTGILGYKLTAAAGDYSDGEQNALPVLTNRVLVTETLPMHFTGNGNHQLDFPAISKLKASSTLQPEGITMEYAGNPIWYAVQALPLLDEPERGSADAYFNQVYANLMSRFIARRIPRFKTVMQQWLVRDTNALKSPLQQNEQLKTVTLQETPWVENAVQESARQEKLAKWFDDQSKPAKLNGSIQKLQELQLSNGGFSWFKGMADDRYITQKVLTGIGRLMNLGAVPDDQATALTSIAQQGIVYLDARIKEAYEGLGKNKDKRTSLTAADIQYLYLRSFFPWISIADSVKPAYRFYQNLARQYWTDQPVSLQAMIALAKYRSRDSATARAILKSLAETAVRDPVKGMHWKATPVFYQWYQAPVEAQSLCIEAFDQIGHDIKTTDDLRNWLLSEKRTQSWATDAATADAVYALLLRGTSWQTTTPQVTVQAGAKRFDFGSGNDDLATGYSKRYIAAGDISADMGQIKVQVKGAGENQPTWGAMYFQYFENMDKISNTGRGLQVSREISLEKTTPQGPVLTPLTKDVSLKVGDKVQIRLVVKVEQNMDYVHLKDVRASCMEPLQTLSGYHWQGGVGYYREVTDAAVHYYFPHLSKGTYVFSYPVYITHGGNYTGGMSTLECLYAPAMHAQSEGVNLRVESR